jgi:tetratricopeptide (TPR) repeat protein
MPQFFRFPAYRAPLVRNLVVSLALAGALALSPWLASLVASFASIYLAYYGFVVIECVARGYLHPNHFPATRPIHPWRPLKLAAILLAAFIAIAVVAVVTGDGVFTLAADIAVALLLPACVMTLAVTDSLRQAIDPRRVFELARRIGAPYLVLFAFLLLLMGGSQQAFELVAPALGESVWWLALASSFVGNYFFLIMCALMGYVLYQYSDALGLQVTGPGESVSGGSAQRQREAVLGRLIAAGDVDGAIGLVERELAQRPDDLSLHERLHRLLQIAGDRARRDAHLERYLDLLHRQPEQALALARDVLAQDPNWAPVSAALTVRLARAALDGGQFDLVLALTRDFETRHADDDSAPTVMLMRAEALSRSGKAGEAQQALRALGTAARPSAGG